MFKKVVLGTKIIIFIDFKFLVKFRLKMANTLYVAMTVRNSTTVIYYHTYLIERHNY